MAAVMSSSGVTPGVRQRFFARMRRIEGARREGQRVMRASWFLATVCLVGLLAASFAIAFRSGVTWVLTHIYHATDLVAGAEALPLWARIAVPAGGALIAGAVSMLSAHGQIGVGNVMEAVVLGRTHLSMRTTLAKSFASWIAIVSGGSVGREGSLIQFGGAAGGLVGERFKMSRAQVRSLIAAGSAAGFAAAYNTPFAAVLFVIEVVTGVVVLDAVAPALIATAIATAYTRFIIGAGPIYGARTFSMRSPFELFAVLGLGILTAGVSLAFMRGLAGAEDLFKRVAPRQPWRAMLGGALAGCVICALPFASGNGYEPLNAVLDGVLGAQLVAIVLVGKAFATCASVGSGSPGGVFTPTMLLGGATGFLFAVALRACGAHIGTSEGYALVGIAAAVAATTHAPMMASVLAFELSGDYGIVLPLVFATAVSTVIARAAQRDSIYRRELTQRGVHWDVTVTERPPPSQT